MFLATCHVKAMKFELLEAIDLLNNQQDNDLKNIHLVIHQKDNQNFHQLENHQVVQILQIQSIYYQNFVTLHPNHQNKLRKKINCIQLL